MLRSTEKIDILLDWRKKCRERLHHNYISEIGKRIQHSKKFTPAEFCRKPRSIKEIDHWKATELRQFLVHIGAVVLKGILSEEAYSHFLCLSVAIIILLKEDTRRQYTYFAKELLVNFVKRFGSLYGSKYISYNVHSLIHLADDAETHVVLDKFSAFKFENKLQHIKRLIHSPNRPLEQIYNRIIERQDSEKVKVNPATGFKKSLPHSRDFGVNSGEYFYSCVLRDCVLKLTTADRYVQLLTGEVGQIEVYLRKADGSDYIIYRSFEKEEDFYKKPIPSSLLGIKVVSQLSRHRKIVPVTQISRRYIYCQAKQSLCPFH